MKITTPELIIDTETREIVFNPTGSIAKGETPLTYRVFHRNLVDAFLDHEELLPLPFPLSDHWKDWWDLPDIARSF